MNNKPKDTKNKKNEKGEFHSKHIKHDPNEESARTVFGLKSPIRDTNSKKKYDE